MLRFVLTYSPPVHFMFCIADDLYNTIPNRPILLPLYWCCWFVRVDYDRIKAVGPDRAASEWLLRCGAKVKFQGFERFHHDYNGLPTGPLGKYKIQAIDATDSCIMYKGFDYLGQWCTSRRYFWVDLLSFNRFSGFFSAHLRADGLKHVEEMKFNRCIYIEDACLERLSSIESLQDSLLSLEVVSCGNVTDKGVIALHRLRSVRFNG